MIIPMALWMISAWSPISVSGWLRKHVLIHDCFPTPKFSPHPKRGDRYILTNIFLVIQSDLFGMVKWPLKGLSDLQLGDKKVTAWITWLNQPCHRSGFLKQVRSYCGRNIRHPLALVKRGAFTNSSGTRCWSKSWQPLGPLLKGAKGIRLT